MAFQIEKLITSIDQFIFWLRENPETPIPTKEIKRLEYIMSQLIHRREISDDEWEKIKPKHEHKIEVSKDDSLWSQLKRFMPISKSTSRTNTEKKKIPLPIRPDFVAKKEIKNDEIIIKNGIKMIICAGCNSPVLPKNISKHKLKCKPLKPKIKKTKILNNTSSSKIMTNPIKDLTENKHLDGSYGLHNFRRENGRFGSHSSYDNMNDESNP